MMDNYNISPNENTYLLLLEHRRKHNHVKVAERIINGLSDEKSVILKNFKLIFIYLQIFEAHDSSLELIYHPMTRFCVLHIKSQLNIFKPRAIYQKIPKWNFAIAFQFCNILWNRKKNINTF
ncbi:hypothetical protein RFI_34062 [Reticulomyxa filosa]|uniref:Uncharacterized protein n=1 Tax=Reticulomyxa filosa TaxID=46433 RepID=X6LN51_RETFI|nr:hypothetical protein RFI_34062 [Reticulomyxa filosa]|eukprot:ETO03348.1 hypothetical protein RFI_34062 [Reticulomyxa filosa]